MKKIILWVLICLLATSAVVIAVFEVKSHRSDNPISGVVYESNTKNNSDTVEEKTPTKPNISIPGWTAIKLPANSREGQVSLYNPIENAEYYDLSFCLSLDTGETVFTTGLIRPGEKCSQVSLERELDAGEYQARLLIQPYLMDENHTPTNNAVINILLIVE